MVGLVADDCVAADRGGVTLYAADRTAGAAIVRNICTHMNGVLAGERSRYCRITVAAVAGKDGAPPLRRCQAAVAVGRCAGLECQAGGVDGAPLGLPVEGAEGDVLVAVVKVFAAAGDDGGAVGGGLDVTYRAVDPFGYRMRSVAVGCRASSRAGSVVR